MTWIDLAWNFLLKSPIGILYYHPDVDLCQLVSFIRQANLSYSVPARLGKGQGAKEIGHNLAREQPKFGHNLLRKRNKIGHA